MCGPSKNLHHVVRQCSLQITSIVWYQNTIYNFSGDCIREFSCYLLEVSLLKGGNGDIALILSAEVNKPFSSCIKTCKNLVIVCQGLTSSWYSLGSVSLHELILAK